MGVKYQSRGLRLLVWLSAFAFDRGAMAQRVVVIVSGTVDYGTDGNPNSSPPGAGNVFHGGADLSGQSFTLTLTFNVSEGASFSDMCPDGSVSQSGNSGATLSSGNTGVLEIGNGSFSLGTISLGALSWSVRRQGSASCAKPYSEVGFSWDEQYTGANSGQTGIGGVNLYTQSNLPNGNWTSVIPQTPVDPVDFQFTIAVQNGANDLAYARGELKAETVAVDGPICTLPFLPGQRLDAGSHRLAYRRQCVCDTSDPTTAKVVAFVVNNQTAAEEVEAETGLSATFVLAWAAKESGYGISSQAVLNNNFFGLETTATAPTSGWFGAVPCTVQQVANYACFPPGIFGNTLYVSALGALLGHNELYLDAALNSQDSGDTIAEIANAIAGAGFNTKDPGPPAYGIEVAGTADAIARRLSCLPSVTGANPMMVVR